MIPMEVGQPSDRNEYLDEVTNHQRRNEKLDFLFKIREQAHLRNEKHKALIAQTTNKRVKARNFPEGTLILRRADGPRRAHEEAKLAPNWEGPFRVKKDLSNGAYKLKTIDGRLIPRTWNSTHLRSYYVQV